MKHRTLEGEEEKQNLETRARLRVFPGPARKLFPVGRWISELEGDGKEAAVLYSAPRRIEKCRDARGNPTGTGSKMVVDRAFDAEATAKRRIKGGFHIPGSVEYKYRDGPKLPCVG